MQEENNFRIASSGFATLSSTEENTSSSVNDAEYGVDLSMSPPDAGSIMSATNTALAKATR